MEEKRLKWTHENVKISDVRKSKDLYILYLDIDIKNPLLINDKIFEERLNSYYLKPLWSREDILSLKWNFYITRGGYIKIKQDGTINSITDKDPNKDYVSFLEIAGPLGTMQSVNNN